jgi:glycine/D-amino acid oxidase-like deaminating enzyme
VAPLYSLALATEPLGRELRERAGLHHRVAFNDLRHLGVYAQLTADDRLVFGGRGAPYHFRSRIKDSFDTSSRVHDRIFRALRQFFPALADVPVTHRWGGPLGVPRDRHPSVGFDRASGHAWAGPYLGDGVAASNLAGRVLRNLVLGREEPINYLPVVDHRGPGWEREPWRWLGLNSRLLSARVADVEERITGRPSRVSDAVERITGPR